MVRISKIYTKTGDDGKTALIDGTRVKKNHPRVNAYGEVDELNSIFGIVRTIAESEGATELAEIISHLQSELFDIGSSLATPPNFDKFPIFKVSEETIQKLEGWIDQITEKVPPLTSFVLPGGTLLNAYLHLARTVCRRLERTLITMAETEPIDPLVVPYFNRLSDLLFALCRGESASKGAAEYLWIPATKR